MLVLGMCDFTTSSVVNTNLKYITFLDQEIYVSLLYVCFPSTLCEVWFITAIRHSAYVIPPHCVLVLYNWIKQIREDVPPLKIVCCHGNQRILGSAWGNAASIDVFYVNKKRKSSDRLTLWHASLGKVQIFVVL